MPGFKVQTPLLFLFYYYYYYFLLITNLRRTIAPPRHGQPMREEINLQYIYIYICCKLTQFTCHKQQQNIVGYIFDPVGATWHIVDRQ